MLKIPRVVIHQMWVRGVQEIKAASMEHFYSNVGGSG